MRHTWVPQLAGALAGLANGLFGGGGGMVWVPLLSRFGHLPPQKLYATCVGVIFPVCLVSAAVYLCKTDFSFLAALPYLLGGAAGGLIGGKLYRRVNPKWMKRLFAAFLIYAGVKYLI